MCHLRPIEDIGVSLSQRTQVRIRRDELVVVWAISRFTEKEKKARSLGQHHCEYLIMMSKSKKSTLPDVVEKQRTRVSMQLDAPKHTESVDYHSAFSSMGFDNSFNFEQFKENFSIKIISMTHNEAIFDVIGIDPPIANALRRIIISEIPSMAIEHVFIVNNTSIMQDEVLAHRLGLIPIQINPSDFQYRSAPGHMTDLDTIVFKLQVKCTRNPDVPEDATEAVKYNNYAVYSKDLIWSPAGNQKDSYENIRPVHEDILICKLRPQQEIELEVHCVKGIGRTHAKWQVVETASYRLMPDIIIKKDITGKDAEKLKQTCPMSVFDIEDVGSKKKANVADPRRCTMCRECIRHPEFEDKIELNRVKDHFIFSVEATGMIPAREIFAEAIRILIARIENLEVEQFWLYNWKEKRKERERERQRLYLGRLAINNVTAFLQTGSMQMQEMIVRQNPLNESEMVGVTHGQLLDAFTRTNTPWGEAPEVDF
ncbi:hypothetical protein PROFUN_05036 [Planoprotostelium fungivorum]|uniref:DNA-directed RNA polymerases I and III subunit RPAC1 n=1 Tax=Planoprotostelium fungivorum TaxID=1890364 RepID=A0A2P6NS79_9EUKA|nr:hypothetical protein PROFUN_05036 [Planoprotostelium fungivorum]